jgi:RimJ/RimL family protein N-acetyltransferase
MPSWEQHIRFIQSNPYLAWHLIEEGPGIVGAIYLTRNGEIGVSIFEKYRGKGFGKAAVIDLMTRYPKMRLVANVAPQNDVSAKMWESLGGKCIQRTYELRAAQ